MKRDGFRTSLWQLNTADFAATTDAPAHQYDVLVVGGGITGITTALLLQQAGQRVAVAEAHSLCYGTTAGTTAHINSFFDTDYATIEKDFGAEAAKLVASATAQARELFAKHVAVYNIDCGFAQKDAYVYAQTSEQSQQLQDMHDAAQRAGAAVAYTQTVPVPAPFEKAIVYHGQAQLHPTRYVLALAKAFVDGGGHVFQQCPVHKVEETDRGLLAETAKGDIRTTHVVWATHIPPGINLLHFRNAPYRSYAAAVRLKNHAYPQALAYDMYDPYHYYRTQDVDGEKYLIVGGEDHKTAHEENTTACLDRLLAHTRQLFGEVDVAAQWSSQYFEPADGLAYIGHLPGNPDNVWVATGFGGNGITYSHIAAPLLTDLITTGQSPYADLFRPGRIKPVAGFAAFVQENADVVKEFVAKRFAVEKIDGLADLAPGEAKVVKLEGETVALYKDDSGGIHAVNPVCTHAKCIVGWNSAEKSWDCPCHGARYSVDGDVLTGPARRGLEKIELGKGD